MAAQRSPILDYARHNIVPAYIDPSTLPPTPVSTGRLLQETGFKILQENGGSILLDATPLPSQ